MSLINSVDEACPGLSEVIRRYSALPAGAIKEVCPTSFSDLPSGFLFVLATWSGQSIAAFRKLTERLAGAPQHPNLMVCDMDALPAHMKAELVGNSIGQMGAPLHGMGDAFFILHSKVVSRAPDLLRSESLLPQWLDSMMATLLNLPITY
ncbi:MAG: hypothetical protein IPK82_17230 [Polyangiaceae bacterium]|nr:hypothetical protein [Polyangiaceae bacterium]